MTVARARLVLLTSALLTAPVVAAHADYLSQGRALAAKGDMRAAQIQLLNALRRDPTNGAAHYLLAETDFALGDAATARAEATDARANGYDPAASETLAAQASLVLGDYARVLHDFPHATGEPIGVSVARGLAQAELGQWDAAAATLAAAAKAAPKDPKPLLALASLALDRNDLVAAQKAVGQALALAPKDPAVRRRDAQVKLRAGDQAGALADLADVLSVDPTDPAARVMRAGIMIARNADAAARVDVKAVLAARPGDVQALYDLVLLDTRAKRFKEAGATLEKLSGVLTRIPQAYLLAAVVQNALGQRAQAEDSALRYAAHFPADPRGGELLGELALRAGHPLAAQDAVAKALAAGARSAALYDLQGRALGALGDSVKASASFAAAVELAPKDPALRARLGAAELASGHPADAVGALRQAVAADPKQAGWQEMLATAAIGAGDLAQAETSLAALRTLGATPATLDNLDGMIAVARRDPKTARTEFESALRTTPDATGPALNLARLDHLEGNGAAADARLEAILQRDPHNAEAMAMLRQSVLASPVSADAIASLERAHAAAPGNPGLAALLGQLYLRAGMPQKALTLAGTDLGAPAEMLELRANAEIALRRPQDAIATDRLLLSEQPRSVAGRLQLAALLMGGGDASGAASVIADGLTIAPQDQALLAAAVGVALKSGGLPSARAKAQTLAGDPLYLPASATLPGDVDMSAKNYAAAIAAYQEASASAPSTLVTLRLAAAQSASGQTAAAEGTLRRWLAAHPADVPVAQRLAALDIAAGRLPDAADELHAVLAQAPSDPVALNNLAWIEQREGDFAAARPLADRAYLLAPTPQTADTLGWIMTRAGNAAAALPLLRGAVAADPADPAMGYHLAAALSATGDRPAAVSLLTKVVSGNSVFEEKAEAERLLGELKRPG